MPKKFIKFFPKKRVALGLAALLALLLILGFSLNSGRERGNFLWLVESKSAKVYVLGSVHLAYPGLYPLSPAIREAFAESEALVVEINTEELPPEYMERFVLLYGLSDDPRPLIDRVSPETRSFLEASGLYDRRYDRLTPWLAALTIQLEVMRQNGFEPQYGLDRHFIKLAQERNMDILELENIDDQMSLMLDMNEEESDIFLRSAVEEMERLPALISGFLDSWRQGDSQGFARLFFEEYDKYPEMLPLLDKMIHQRNRRMAAEIDLLLERRDRVYFVVVGAGHLVGPESILELLAREGYKVEQQ